MRAIVQDTYGDADVLRLEQVERPEPGRQQVLIRVRAAGVDPSVWHIMAGRPIGVRPAFGTVLVQAKRPSIRRGSTTFRCRRTSYP